MNGYLSYFRPKNHSIEQLKLNNKLGYFLVIYLLSLINVGDNNKTFITQTHMYFFTTYNLKGLELNMNMKEMLICEK